MPISDAHYENTKRLEAPAACVCLVAFQCAPSAPFQCAPFCIEVVVSSSSSSNVAAVERQRRRFMYLLFALISTRSVKIIRKHAHAQRRLRAQHYGGMAAVTKSSASSYGGRPCHDRSDRNRSGAGAHSTPSHRSAHRRTQQLHRSYHRAPSSTIHFNLQQV